MYNLAPPENSTDWPFGLVLDLCFRVGLGKPELGYVSWKDSEIIQFLNLAEDSSTIRNWKTGGGISDKYLDRLIDSLTAHEQHQKEWELVIRHSALHLQPTKLIQSIRKEAFGVTRFTTKNFKAAMDKYNEKFRALSLRDIQSKLSFQKDAFEESVVIPKLNMWDQTKEKLLSTKYLGGLALILLMGLIPWLFNSADKLPVGSSQKIQGIDYQNIIFTNIRFCSESDFDHHSNICLAQSDSFKYGINKINISFESEQLQKGSVVNLRWYRYGEKFAESSQSWTYAFAKDLQYASTFIAPPIEGFLPNNDIAVGRYHVRFYLGETLIDEAGFQVTN